MSLRAIGEKHSVDPLVEKPLRRRGIEAERPAERRGAIAHQLVPKRRYDSGGGEAAFIFHSGISSYQKEAPRLCRGGSRSLTFQEVVHRRDFQS